MSASACWQSRVRAADDSPAEDQASPAPVAPSSTGLGPRGAPDSLALWTVLFRAALERGLRMGGDTLRPQLVCLSRHDGAQVVGPPRAITDPPPGVVAAFDSIDSLVVRPLSACRVQPWRGAGPLSHMMVDTLTGRLGISVWASPPAFGPDGGFTVLLGYFAHGRSAGGWTCHGRRLIRWEITACRRTWIS